MPENANESPRISFSNDFCHHESIPIEQRTSQSPYDISNFYWGFPLEFSIPRGAISGESSWSAEEFFNDGKILPIEMKKIPEPIYRSKTDKYKTGLPRPEIIPIEDFEPVLEIEEIGDQEYENNHGGYNYKGHGGVIRVSSFLDMVPSGNLFGLGSINFDGGRNKNKIRSMFFYW
ncbi:hypothetical protein AT5G38320 [Arabidopsis thaliana]|uniref:Uncharacterized protein n=1 Tax=Arabidopsis thaliana TaxID=3702 RepID=B3H5W1_ARATH|nr:uncharacterized protein AT5G38320 [Arabidopsis thaliana]AED94297.1 hypothetical protein AT5G38320 [Arabidopsis thaliana]|eukprot:NP_001119330.1 hypothetical protein AT5G38320 [Arabidopsis thaliana]